MINSLTKLALIDGLKNIRNGEKFENTYPKQITNYFKNISEKELTEEIKIIISDKYRETKLSRAIVEFLSKDLGSIVDEYYCGNKKNIEIDTKNSLFEKNLFEILENSTYNEISEKIARELFKISQGEIIIIESPVNLDLSMKSKIREKYQQDDALNFIVFKVNENILGGIKTYKDGKIIDDSWAQKIEKLEYIGA